MISPSLEELSILQSWLMDIDEDTFAMTISDFNGSAFATHPNHMLQMGASLITAVIYQPSKINPPGRCQRISSRARECHI
jgi:hypothetical protein